MFRKLVVWNNQWWKLLASHCHPWGLSYYYVWFDRILKSKPLRLSLWGLTQRRLYSHRRTTTESIFLQTATLCWRLCAYDSKRISISVSNLYFSIRRIPIVQVYFSFLNYFCPRVLFFKNISSLHCVCLCRLLFSKLYFSRYIYIHIYFLKHYVYRFFMCRIY